MAKSCLTGFVTPWTAALQAPLSMGFPSQGYWNGLPFHSPGDLLGSGIKPMSPPLADGFFTTEPPGKTTRLKNASVTFTKDATLWSQDLLSSANNTKENLQGITLQYTALSPTGSGP